jgi:hypothetical protein
MTIRNGFLLSFGLQMNGQTSGAFGSQTNGDVQVRSDRRSTGRHSGAANLVLGVSTALRTTIRNSLLATVRIADEQEQQQSAWPATRPSWGGGQDGSAVPAGLELPVLPTRH